MRVYDVIKKKRDGEVLTKDEIDFIVNGYVLGDIPDYQISAFLMAIYFKDMTVEETTNLTFAIRDSGEILSYKGIDGIRADKHSTGGVGDKTSLTVAPIVATLGLKVAKMSGRGLGHTGGTIDKLESIPNFNTALDVKTFNEIVSDVGVCIIGQTASLAPADKKLYALRDVTATVDSIPLIVSSIMGKKLCADDDVIVLDVKTGNGSFMKTLKESEELATLMVEIGKNAGKKIMALVTDMNAPLGKAIGNSLEVIEAVNALKGKGEPDYIELCTALSANMLYLAGKGDYDYCVREVQRVIEDGSAFNTFVKMVERQGGDVSVILDADKFKKATYSYEIKAEKSGYITEVDTEGYGLTALILGAGRSKMDDKIDHSAGIILNKKTGDYVLKGELIATLYSSDKAKFVSASQKFISSTVIGDNIKDGNRKVVLKKIF